MPGSECLRCQPIRGPPFTGALSVERRLRIHTGTDPIGKRSVPLA